MIRSNLHDKFERNPTSWRTSLNHFLWSSWSFGAETDVEVNMAILFCLTAIFGNLLVVSVIITEPRDSRLQNVTVAWILIKKEFILFVCLFVCSDIFLLQRIINAVYSISDFGSSSKRLPHEVRGLWHRHIKISPCYFTSSEYQKSVEKPWTYLIENQI